MVWYSVEDGVEVIEAAEQWRLVQLKNRAALRGDAVPESILRFAPE
jgi:hypothetical protein